MEDGLTPQSGGRGRRPRNQPFRFNYTALGNPDLGANLTKPSVSSNHCPMTTPKAPSVHSHVSSTVSRIKANELDLRMKLAELEEEIDDHNGKLYDLNLEMQRKEQLLVRLKSKKTTPSTITEIDQLEVDIINIKTDIRQAENKIASLQRSFQRRKEVLEKYAELEKDVIMEENDQDIDEELDGVDDANDDENRKRMEEWVKIQQQQPLANDGTPAIPAKGPLPNHSSQYVPPQKENIDSHNLTVTDLVSALQKLVPAQTQPTVINVPDYKDRELPFFSGHAEDWLIFINEYRRIESRDPGVNLSRLRKHLKGSANEAVHHLLTNPLNLPKILDVLEKRFGNPKHIIATLIEKAKDVKSPSLEKPETIINYGVAVDALVTNIISYNMQDYINNIQLLNELVEKLPATLRREWYNYLDWTHAAENLVSFQKWMENEVNTAYRSVKPKINDGDNRSQDKRQRKPGVHAAREDFSCNYCDMKNHRIDDCRKFSKLTHDEKIDAAKGKGLCFKCLQKGHRSPDCDKKVSCGVNSCTGSHHRLLHRVKQDNGRKDEKDKMKESPPPATDDPTPVIASASGGEMCLIPVKVSGPQGSETVLALLDTGSSLTMLEEDVAKRIGLKGKVKPLSFNVFGKDVRTHPQSKIVSMEVKGFQRGSSAFEIKNGRTVSFLGIPASPLKINKIKEKYPYLECVRAKDIPNKKPQMIIGADNHRLFRPLQAIEDPEEKGPSGNLCRLGWYFSDVTGGSNCYFACQSCHQQDDPELHQSMKDFFAVEENGVKANVTPSRSKEDLRALKLLEDNTKQVGDRWQTCLLWNQDNLELPSSKHMALNRLQLMEKKMDKNEEFAKLCCDKFADYIEKGFLVPVEDVKEKVEPSKRKWFLPWFFAYHPTKKPRLVFDAAAKAGGKSLNDFLLKGPDLINSLQDVLMRFRSFPIAITGDIKEMFHQVRLQPEDWPSQTIMFRGMDRTQPPKEYYMTVLFFGAASSPCSAIFTKNKNADQFIEKYPEAVAAIKSSDYVDDFLCGAKSENEAITLQQQVTEIHASGGFQIVKWNSNSKKVLEAIPESMRAERSQVIMLKGDIVLEKTLGMWWNPKEDCFQFKLSLNKIPEEVKGGSRHPTKREVTSFVMSLFDPIGFVSPVKVRALIIIQNIWRSGIGWDDEISATVNEHWTEWVKELHEISDVKIQRKYTSFLDPDEVNLHVFVDASEVAYAAVIFFVFRHGDKFEMTFVAGKARVAPLKGLTIPRMELQAALMGSRLSTTITACFRKIYVMKSSTFWSDSKTVLCWLRSESGRFKVFVQTRVGEILELTDCSAWRWVPTKLNIADDATRARRNEDFSSTCRWLSGEEFLMLEKTEWPEENITPIVNEEDLEIRNAVFVSKPQQHYAVPDISRFSSWIKLIRSTAAVFNAFRRFRKVTSPTKCISVEDMEKAETLWIKQAQLDSFAEELEILKNVKTGESPSLPKNSRLTSLSPALSEEGIIILGGRIDAAPHVSETVKRPPILDPVHPYTKLLLKWLHEGNGHQGQEAVMNLARKRAWIIDCRKAVRSTWANCQQCKLKKLQPVIPEMGQLPSSRLGESHSPFFHTGVDYFGPLQVKINRSTVKRWGVLFTCMTTRAVHFELADGLDSGEFLNVLSRFISVRGPPSHMWSDNGTNFVGANKELKAAATDWNSDEVCRALSVKGIQWHFIPPASPHMGGSYERLIGMAKKILSSMLNCQAPRESVLRTLLFEAMNIMNARPLTYASTDPSDAECLTPNHFLRMSALEGPTIPGLYDAKDKFRSSWKYCQHLANEFWKRWTDECLPSMAQRATWRNKCEPMKEGDVVILKDNLVPRSSWKKGIIIKVYPGRDGQVRIVDVRVAVLKPGESKTPTIKIYRRSVVKVIPTGESVVLGQHWEGGNVPVQSE